MDPIEKAIRGALQKGNLEEKAFRLKIYAAAEQALLRSLASKAELGDSDRQRRIGQLQRIVKNIETEFAPAVASEFERVPNVSSPFSSAVAARPSDIRQPTSRIEPVVTQSDLIERAVLARRESAQLTVHNEISKEKLRSGRLERYVGLFLLIVFLALVMMFAWAAWNSGLLKKATNATPTTPNNTAVVSEEAPPRLGSGPDTDEGWITVFEPSDASSVEVSEGLSAELEGRGPNSNLKISSTGSASANSEANFEIGRGVLETLRGKKVVFDIQAKTNDGATTEIAVSCELAGMGDCQRTRFRLQGQMSDHLLTVQLSEAGPEASGTLSISPDLNATGKPIQIFSIRVRAEQ